MTRQEMEKLKETYKDYDLFISDNYASIYCCWWHACYNGHCYPIGKDQNKPGNITRQMKKFIEAVKHYEAKDDLYRSVKYNVDHGYPPEKDTIVYNYLYEFILKDRADKTRRIEEEEFEKWLLDNPRETWEI